MLSPDFSRTPSVDPLGTGVPARDPPGGIEDKQGYIRDGIDQKLGGDRMRIWWVCPKNRIGHRVSRGDWSSIMPV